MERKVFHSDSKPSPGLCQVSHKFKRFRLILIQGSESLKEPKAMPDCLIAGATVLHRENGPYREERIPDHIPGCAQGGQDTPEEQLGYQGMVPCNQGMSHMLRGIH